MYYYNIKIYLRCFGFNIANNYIRKVKLLNIIVVQVCIFVQNTSIYFFQLTYLSFEDLKKLITHNQRRTQTCCDTPLQAFKIYLNDSLFT